MKQKIYTFIVAALIISLFGCIKKGEVVESFKPANKSDGTIAYRSSEDGINIRDRDGVEKLTRADINAARAEQIRATTEQIRQGNIGTFVGTYPGLIKNDDMCLDLNIDHPNMKDSIEVSPNDYGELVTQKIPKDLTIRWSDRTTKERITVYEKDFIYDGKQYRWGADVQSGRSPKKCK